MRPVLVIAGVELRRLQRDRSSYFFVLALPLLLVLVIGAQFSDGSNGRVAVAGGEGTLREALVRALRADDVEVTLASPETVREKVARGRADVGIVVSSQAARAFETGEDLEFTLIPGARSNSSAVLHRTRSVLSRLTVRSGQLAALTDRGLSPDAARSALVDAARSLRRPTLEVVDVDEGVQEFSGLGQFDISARGQTLLFVFLNALAGASALIRTRRLGVLSRTLAAPVSVRQVLVGQALGRLAVAAFQAVYIVLLTAVLFGVEWGPPGPVLLVLFLFSAVAAGTGLLIGTLADSDTVASGLGVGLGLVLAALGGGMIPLELFGPTLRSVAHLTPHAWAYDALAQIRGHGAGALDVLPELGVLAAMALALLFLGTWTLRRSTARGL
jgi:ABC-2 type transport system permease protein